jgi:DUF4097 and DUF4098 domain-containing protein YvlB
LKNREGDTFSYRHKLSNGNLTIIGEIEKKQNWVPNLKVKFKLLIPENYNVELNTSDGSLSIEDLIGKHNARTSGDYINVDNIVGDMKLHTSGGSIHTDTITGNLNVHTSGGNIKVTVNKQLTEAAKFITYWGSITANLIPDVQLNISISTSGRSVKSDFEIDAIVKKCLLGDQ